MERKEKWQMITIKTQNGNCLDYLVSNKGKIVYPEREVLTRWGNYRKKPQSEAKISYTQGGYQRCSVGLIHRAVAEAWVEKPKDWEDSTLWTVNHIDGDKQNNHADNLEWVKHSINCQKYFQSDKAIEDGKNHPVEVWKNDEWIGVFPSKSIAADSLGVFKQAINKVIKGEQKTTGGYKIKEITKEQYHAKKDTKRL